MARCFVVILSVLLAGPGLLDAQTAKEISLPGGVKMAFAFIGPGTFQMGSKKSEKGRYEHEGPRHKVNISRAFYMGQYEVTQGQWEAVMETRPWSDGSYVKEGPDYAASYVSWDAAREFCELLSKREGKTYRLPTEAEWEYACRAGTTTVYGFGDDASRLGEYAWFEDNADDAGEEYAHRVGQKKANPFGLHDMHGNVWEWCQDWYESDYYKASPVDDPTGPSTASYRVYRGGSWGSGARRCRSADRSGSTPSGRGLNLGFRVALVPPSE